MKKIIIWVIAAIAVIVAVYFGLAVFKMPPGGASTPTAESQPSSPQTQTQVQNQTQTPSAGAANVAIRNFAFAPATLTVKAGDTVTWTNDDSVPHQIKSETFNSASLSRGQTFSFTFQTAGTYDYSCAIHPSMKGQIIVQ